MTIPTYGKTLLIKNCVIGPNLNLMSVIGFAGLDVLADISSADEYDQIDNKFGTQRPLKSAHAREASEYAFGAVSANANADPRAFSEVILNARDAELVKVYRDGRLLDFRSVDSGSGNTTVVDLEINLELLSYPQPKFGPQISRVDGNHRLSAIPPIGDRDGVEFPSIPFALFVDLTSDQERKLFRDINGTQVKVNTAHLSQIHIALEGDRAILDPGSRSLWVTKKLASPGFAFQEMVYMGGAKAGIKKATGSTPPINLNSLDSMVKETLRGLEGILVELFPEDKVDSARAGDVDDFEDLLMNGEKLANLLNRFWVAVKDAFPEAWQDKRNHILLQSIGLMGTSKLASEVIRELVREQRVDPSAFAMEIRKIKSAGFSYDKGQYSGFAGGAGAQKVFTQLIEKRAEGRNTIGPVIDQL
jgi:DGQHR domain-containing protein